MIAIQEGIDEANSPDAVWYTHEEVKADLRRRYGLLDELSAETQELQCDDCALCELYSGPNQTTIDAMNEEAEDEALSVEEFWIKLREELPELYATEDSVNDADWDALEVDDILSCKCTLVDRKFTEEEIQALDAYKPEPIKLDLPKATPFFSPE